MTQGQGSSAGLFCVFESPLELANPSAPVIPSIRGGVNRPQVKQLHPYSLRVSVQQRLELVGFRVFFRVFVPLMSRFFKWFYNVVPPKL